ncbi:hypothetical protein [Weissella cibaria]|uniref:hypothetical protein n=1 Tax=Weissella cibaria TaxID=137591 RepID=UPI0021C24559|nr:hypothetical protein [Weissella cibaria]MCT8400072.1 hypothetical protein [Weissella cibaria]
MTEDFNTNVEEVLTKLISIGLSSNSNEKIANIFTTKLKLKKPKYDEVTTGLRLIEQEDKNRYLEILNLIYRQIDTDTKDKLKYELNQ